MHAALASHAQKAGRAGASRITEQARERQEKVASLTRQWQENDALQYHYPTAAAYIKANAGSVRAKH